MKTEVYTAPHTLTVHLKLTTFGRGSWEADLTLGSALYHRAFTTKKAALRWAEYIIGAKPKRISGAVA